MRSCTPCQLLTGLTLLMALAHLNGDAGDLEPYARRKDKEMIELTINVPKQLVQVGEKVSYTVEFKNVHGLLPITFWWFLDDFYDFVTLRETSPSGRVLTVNSVVLSKLATTAQAYTLKPGEKKVREFFFEPAELGEYLIEAQFDYLSLHVKATPVKIKVVPKEEKKQ